MVSGRYSNPPENPSKACKSRGSNLRVHFKHCREVGQAIKKLKLTRAIRYMEEVLEKKDSIPFLRYTGGCGRHAIGKLHKAPGNAARWPMKATGFMLGLLKNAEANAETKGLDIDNLYVTHVQVNRAPKMRRRTYRAHGRIGPYMSNPCHIELICTERAEQVEKDGEEDVPVRLSRRQLARKRIMAGGGVAAIDN